MIRTHRQRATAAAVALALLALAASCKTYKVSQDPVSWGAPPTTRFSAPPLVTTTTGWPPAAPTTMPVPPASPASLPGPPATTAPAAGPSVTFPPAVQTPAAQIQIPVRLWVGGTPNTAALVTPAVVAIDGVLGAQHDYGTGMVLTTSGQVLTNSHVVRNARTITATIVSTGRVYTARVIGRDATADVALLQLQAPSGLVGITTGTSGNVARGDPVSAVGHVTGRGSPSITNCSVVATGQSLVASDANGGVEHLTNLIEISIPSQPGDSGGPLANSSGQVIGMLVAGADGAGYAIPMATVLGVAQRIQGGA